MITLYNWWLPCRYCTPGDANSIRMITLKAVPNIPEKIAKIRYSVPISLAFVLNNHRVILKKIIFVYLIAFKYVRMRL